ncbi:MAG: RHS repeat-associated core domain-containing protein [Terriglobales bacterium]
MDGVRWGSLQQNGDGRYTLPDALGSTAVFAQDGTVQPLRFYPFGEEAQATSAEYKWTNQIRDANALDHFAFRTYPSNLGRWLSPDPAGLAAIGPADPQSFNRYAYVGNQPLELTDPLGLDGNGNATGCMPNGSGGVHCANGPVVTVSGPWALLDPALWDFAFVEAMQPQLPSGSQSRRGGGAPSAPAPKPPAPQTHLTQSQQTVNAVNNQFGTNVPGSDVLPLPAGRST